MLSDVLLGAGAYQVDLQIGELVLVLIIRKHGSAASQKPRVDIVVAQVRQAAQVGREGGQVFGGIGERRTLKNEESGFVVDLAVEGDASTSLIYRKLASFRLCGGRIG